MDMSFAEFEPIPAPFNQNIETTAVKENYTTKDFFIILLILMIGNGA